MSLRGDASQIFAAALEAVDAGNAVRRHLAVSGSRLRAGECEAELGNFERVRLLAVGKAALPMARAVCDVLGERLAQALAVTKRGHTAGNSDFSCIEAGHPVPDREGLHAALAVRDFVSECGERDLLITAISGGASALLPAPAPPVTLADKQKTTSLLLEAGADINELNAVRKHLSFLKGGRLAALASPATVISLLLSDVVGDKLDVIGSGLTAPDPTTYQHALNVLDRYGLRDAVPRAVRERLERADDETPKLGDPIFAHVCNVVVGSNGLALQAAAAKAQELGYRVRIVSSEIQGEARAVAKELVGVLREESRPVCLLAGGETTVTVRGAGKGGRNQEFALAAAIAIEDAENVAVLSAGTDGTDGPTDAAGAIATGETLARARRIGLSAEEYLAHNDSYCFFDALNDLIRTGPTGTNVMDIHILLAR